MVDITPYFSVKFYKQQNTKINHKNNMYKIKVHQLRLDIYYAMSDSGF